MTLLEVMMTNKPYKLPKHETFGKLLDTNANIVFNFPVINGTISERLTLNDLLSDEWVVNEE